MPDVTELKKSLGFNPGDALGADFVIRDVEAHMDEKKYRELYNFKVHLWVEPKNQAAAHDLRRKRVADNTLEDAKTALLKKDNEIMYSSYGSPYEVRLEHVKASPPSGNKEGQGQWIELEALAVAKRRRDIPRLAEQHGAETSEDEEEAADDEMKGEHIAKPAGDKSRGGWAHTVCLANQPHEGQA